MHRGLRASLLAFCVAGAALGALQGAWCTPWRPLGSGLCACNSRGRRGIWCSAIHIHTYIHTCIHTYIDTYIHMYVRTYIHTYLHTIYSKQNTSCSIGSYNLTQPSSLTTSDSTHVTTLISLPSTRWTHLTHLISLNPSHSPLFLHLLFHFQVSLLLFSCFCAESVSY